MDDAFEKYYNKQEDAIRRGDVYVRFHEELQDEP
jgi:hypothetical protein